MENAEEAIRLEVKTDPDAVRKQALWCGIKPGQRVLDLGCGSGKTTAILYEMVQPGGSVVGVDYSSERIAYAGKHYGGKEGIAFLSRDLTEPLHGIGQFDLIWVRFVLEYYRKESPSIVRNLKNLLKPGACLCLIDLDYNCLSHYELPAGIGDILPFYVCGITADDNNLYRRCDFSYFCQTFCPSHARHHQVQNNKGNPVFFPADNGQGSFAVFRRQDAVTAKTEQFAACFDKMPLIIHQQYGFVAF